MIVMIIPGAGMPTLGMIISGIGCVLGSLLYMLKMRRRIVDSLIVNMVDVGEETGELELEGGTRLNQEHEQIDH